MGTLKSAPKMRSKTTLTRPRPKTIHVDSGSVEMAEGMLQPSSGKKGSSTNLTGNAKSNYNFLSMSACSIGVIFIFRLIVVVFFDLVVVCS